MRKQIIRVLIGFGIAIHEALIFGTLFRLYAIEQLPKDRQDDVLIKAIPFVAIFVAIVLAFICLIVILAIVFNGKISPRAYRPIEALIIAGILIGVVGLFQSWKLFAYEYGFLMLLFSLIAFMVWSHIAPRRLRFNETLAPLRTRDHVVGLVLGGIVTAVVAVSVISATKPEAPYGLSPARWQIAQKRGDDAQIIKDAEDEYQKTKIPFFIAFSLLPGGIVYFAAREAAASLSRRQGAADHEGQPRTQGGPEYSPG